MLHPKVTDYVLDVPGLLQSVREEDSQLCEKIASQMTAFESQVPKPSTPYPDAFYGLIIYEKVASQVPGIEEDRIHRHVLMCDRNSTMVQAAFIAERAGSWPPLLAKTAAHYCLKAAERYGVTVDERLEKIAGEGVSSPIISWEHLVREQGHSKQAAAGPEHFAITIKGRPLYPIDTEAQVKIAMDYFGEYDLLFTLPLRHEMARNIAARAETLGVPLTEKVATAAVETFSESAEAMLDMRRRYAQPDQLEALNKLASAKDQLGAVKFAEALNAFDQKTGIADRHRLPNAYQSTLGKKQQTKEASLGDLGLTESDLRSGVTTHQAKLATYLGQHLTQSLAAHPTATYQGLSEAAKDVLHQVLSGRL